MLFFFKINFFEKKKFRNICNFRVSNSLDPDQDRRFVGPDLGPNCLQRLSAVGKQLRDICVFSTGSENGNAGVSCFAPTICILMNYSTWFDTMNIGRLIIHVKISQRRIQASCGCMCPVSLPRGAVGWSVTLPGYSHLLIFCLLLSIVFINRQKGYVITDKYPDKSNPNLAPCTSRLIICPCMLVSTHNEYLLFVRFTSIGSAISYFHKQTE